MSVINFYHGYDFFFFFIRVGTQKIKGAILERVKGSLRNCNALKLPLLHGKSAGEMTRSKRHSRKYLPLKTLIYFPRSVPSDLFRCFSWAVTDYSFHENTLCPYRNQHFITVFTK
jgi:hypothetical protein